MNKLTTTEIKERLNKSEVTPLFLRELESDPRKSVQSLLLSYNRNLEKLNKLKKDYNEKTFFEKTFWSKDELVAGLDEVGRGCLAGPVVCASVILDPNDPIMGINDSKKLSAKERKRLSNEIKNRSIIYSIAVISPKTIDQINILEASRYGMQQALHKLSIQPQNLLIDAVKINSEIPQTSIIKGDSKSVSIGAASIVAKVYRDELMDLYDSFYPEYGFKKNKGYGTSEHLQALKNYGISPIHRLSFSPVMKSFA